MSAKSINRSLRKRSLWILICNIAWIAMWTADGVHYARATGRLDPVDIVHVLILISGIVTEYVRSRIAQIVNVGYFAGYALWLLAKVVLDLVRPVQEPAGLALEFALIGIPMFVVAAINLRLYRR